MLRRRYNGKRRRLEWALVSGAGKVLQWFGVKKPSEWRVRRAEARVNYFKHKGD